jgi:spermidine synthase
LQPWRTIESVETPEGRLELRQRGTRSFLMTIGGRVLMTSEAHESEEALARMACEVLAGRRAPRVLLGGLGMGFTLRGVLDHLPAKAAVTVVDLNRHTVAWCRGPLAALTANPLGDRRVEVRIADVARVIAEARPGQFDAIVLDLYEGPHEATGRPSHALYGLTALARTRAALREDGVLAIWSEERDGPFEGRLGAAGFQVESRRTRAGQGRAHTVYLALPAGRGPRR